MFGPLQKLGRALVRAAHGRTEEVIALLDQGADIEATDGVRHVILLLKWFLYYMHKVEVLF